MLTVHGFLQGFNSDLIYASQNDLPSRNCRNDSADISEDIYKDPERREVREFVPDDDESFINGLDPELQEVYKDVVDCFENEECVSRK
jgi:hypothetical protein